MKRVLSKSLLLAVLLAGSASSQEDDQAKKTKKFQKDMTEIRGLDFKKDVKVGSYSKAELVEFLKNDEDMMTVEEAAVFQKAYAHFGLFPAEGDLRKALLDMLQDSVAGFYHPRTKELRLIKDGKDEAGELENELGIRFEDITFVHELCHAAQDQNHDLNTLPFEDETNDDLSLAVRSLVEGDATIVGMKFGFKENYDTLAKMFTEEYKTGSLPGKAGALPAYLRKGLTFPYGYGTEFVQRVLERGKGNWKAVSAAFDDLPSSTEQILHPRKYTATPRDYPQVITLDLAPLKNFKPVTHNVLGEFGIGVLLDEYKQGLARDRNMAAEGWDGDRYHVLEDGRNVASVWFSTWDSEDDAEEFFVAYSALLLSKYEGAKKEAVAQKLALQTAAGRHSVIERRGTDVMVFDNVDAASTAHFNAVWTSAKKVELKTVARVPVKEPKKK